jgi:sigma-B regulation protein RsbU (phosphoserine phosphatase)
VKILIVEDDRSAQILLRATLQRVGHEVVIAEDGQAALDALERDSFPLVISDWMMPRLSGIELCRAVREREVRRLAQGRPPGYTYLMLLTALDAKADYIEAMDAGADDLLTKPCDPDMLRARLRVGERIIGLLKQMQQLEGLLPICSYCKKIREGEASATQPASWVAIESYVSSRSEASFSHGVCPTCYAQHLQPQLDAIRMERAKKE